MRYEIMKDYEVDALKRDISKSLTSGDSSSRSGSDARRNIESAVQELQRALSSLERSTDSRIRELQQAASSSSRGSSGYSSYESGIRDARREANRAISKIEEQLRGRPDNRSCGYSYSGGDASRKLDKLVDALKKANSELRSTTRNIDDLASENKGLKRKIGGLGSDVAKIAADAAMANATSQEEIRQVQRDNELIIADLKRHYEREIRMLQKAVSQKTSENAALSAKIAARGGLDDDNWEPAETGLTIAEDYAILWNDILEDAIIELREVRHIQKWLIKNKLETEDAFELARCCESIIARGEVLGSDAQRLYDCSFKLLGSLGAKLRDGE